MRSTPPPTDVLLRIARDAVTSALENRDFSPPRLDPPWDATQGVFVTLRGAQGELRGCIGHISGVCGSLAEEIAQCALAAALEDPRFHPVTQHEFTKVSLELCLLGPLEQISSPSELDPRKWGVVVSNGHRRGLLLPDLAEVDDVETQISVARKKAGILPNEPIVIHRFLVDKFKESR